MMGGGSGREMRRLVLAVSIMVILLVLAIITYFLVDVIVSTNRNIKHSKQVVVEKAVLRMTGFSGSVTDMQRNPEVIRLFNQDIVSAALKGDTKTIYGFILDISATMLPVEYVGIIIDGDLYDYRIRVGTEVDPGSLPLEPPQEEYGTLDSLNGEEGVFVSLFYSVDLRILGIEQEIYVNSIDDITDEVRAVEAYFEDQFNDAIVRLCIAAAAALLLSTIITTFGLRYFTSKYISRPMQELNRMAEDIADGTFQGEVQIDENSAFSAIQGLLRSGQKVLHRFDQEID